GSSVAASVAIDSKFIALAHLLHLILLFQPKPLPGYPRVLACTALPKHLKPCQECTKTNLWQNR
ncbi:MAG: hypothetical protein MKZ95_14985, partial [Pirellulales bacterium]|nr:hypothetical protein [Pirellulales bacterium]